MDMKALLFSAKGRLDRGRFLLIWLVISVANFVLGWTFIVPAVVLWIGICISAKRFHDVGRSGWYAVIPMMLHAVTFCAVPVIVELELVEWGGERTAEQNRQLETARWVWTTTNCFIAAFVIWQGALPGDPADNRYGSPLPPLRRRAAAT